MLKKRSCIAALLACIALHSVSARNIFVTPGGDPANSSISAFTNDPLSFAGTYLSAAGGTQVLAGPSNKYYVIGRVASDGVVVMQGTPQALQLVKRISTPGIPTGAAISPDGRRLVVVGSGVVVIDTATDTPISSTVSVGTTPVAVGISSDSKRAFVASQDQQKMFAISLDNVTAAGQAATPGLPTTVNVSPGGLVYVTVQNAVYEFDPQTLEQRGTFSLNGFPGAIAFTPDGKFGITPNSSTVTGRSAFILNLALRTVTDIPATPFALSKMLFADSNTAFALSTQTGRIYTVSVAAPAVPAVYSVPGVTFESVRDITLSNEVPARGLYVLTMAGSLYRVDLSQNTAVGPVTSPLNGAVNYAGPAATGAPNSLLSLNTSQTLAPGGTSLPLIVRALDPQGTPLAGVAVTFSISGNGNLTTTSTTTDLLGYAQTIASIPATAANGVATVTATAGGQQAAFGITISTNTGGGGGGGGGTPNTGGLQIVLGQGQVTGQGFPTSQPFTVIVKDSAGTPQPNVPIAWTIVEGGGGLGSVDSATDANGIARASYANFLVPLGVPFSQATVSASTGTDTVNFIVTTVPRLPSGAPGEATYTLLAPLDRTLNLRAGETAAGAVQIAVGSLTGYPIPNVGLRLETDDPAGPQIACRGGVPLSDVNGLVTCDVTATGTIGDTSGRIIVGERVQFQITIHVAAGAPSVVRITGGNNQTGNAGQALPNPLIAEVTDAGGNLLPAVPVTWAVISGTATLTQTSAQTNQNGRAQTNVTLGQQPGPVQVRVRAGTGEATFTLTTNLNASGLTVTGGAGQSAVIGQAFATPISVRVTSSTGAPVPSAAVSFSVTSGSATVPSPATTNADGVASVTVTAGQVAGPVVVRASIGSLTQDINLTVRTPGPVFSASSIVNAAGYQPGISPGTIAYITAAGIATGIAGSVTPPNIVGPLPTNLAGVEVSFNGVLSPIFSLSNIAGVESVVVQVPFEVTPGQASVTIRTAGGGSTTVNGIQIMAVKPGIFDYVDSNRQRVASVLRPDGSYVSSTNPARRGEIIRVFVDGLGQTTPATGTNRAGLRDQNVLSDVISGINNEGVRTVSAKLQEGTIGVYIVEMEVPANTTPGAARPLAVAVPGPDGAPVYGGSAIPIQ